MAAENGHGVRTVLDGASDRLVTALRARQELVHWAGKAIDMYTVRSSSDGVPDQA